MMKKHSFIPLFALLLWHCSLSAQSTETHHRHHFRFSLGVGYDDGLALLKTVPAIGLSYERSLSKRFALSANLYSYYRSMPDSYFDSDLNARRIFDIFARGASQPFFTETEEALLNQGVIHLSPRNTVKSLSLPIDIGITWYPINSQRHSLGFNFAFAMVYSSFNWWRDYSTIVKIVFEDGTVINPDTIAFSLNSEFHSVTPELSMKLIYEYKFKNYGLGVRLANYGYTDLGMDFFRGSGLAVWDSSVFFTYKLP